MKKFPLKGETLVIYVDFNKHFCDTLAHSACCHVGVQTGHQSSCTFACAFIYFFHV